MPDDLFLQFHGAARTTTGSRHLLMFEDRRLLVDCGLYQGRRKDTYRRNLNFSFSPKEVDAALLTHAHIDHSGNLPNLVKRGFEGDIYATPATSDLARVMLRDSAFIQEKDAEWLTRHKRKRGSDETIQPLYTQEDAEACVERFRSVPYHRFFNPLERVRAVFYDAGHILGSSSVVLELGANGGQARRIAFSGDIGRAGLPLLRDPEIPHDLDWLVMEGTYGARTHDPVSEAKEELRATVQRVAERGGRIIVPSFSVERTQEIVYHLNNLFNEGALPPIPIFVDSPLAVNVTEIFRLHPECFNRETHRVMLTDDDPLGFDRLTYTRSVEQSKAINTLQGACMIISASGMCEAGRILHHLRNNIGDPKNCVCFVGYQAEGTLGRRIVERAKEVNIFGEPHALRAEVVTLNTMSGHADKNDLFAYAKTVRDASPNLKKVFLIHGESGGLETLAARLRGELGLAVEIGEEGATYALEG